MLRLVKGAYWDSEIKRAQVEGLEGFSVFTRKIHTDVSYIACAKRLLDGAGRGVPAIRHPQRADARDDPRHGRREFLRRAIRVPVPARHGRAALQPDRRRRARSAAVPRLRAGRLARNAARLSGAAPARERRQHLVRQPHRRRVGVDRGADRRPGRGGAARSIRSARRTRRSRCRATSSRPSAPNSAGLDLSNEARLAALGGMARQERADRMARRRRGRRGAADRQSRPIRATSSARSSTPSREDVERAFAAAAQGRPGLGGARARPNAPRSSPPRRSAIEDKARRARRADRAAKRARRCPMRWATCARRSTSCAITALASPAAISPTRPIRRSEPSSASARGTSRSRSSPARSPRRWRPATRSSPSRPRRRRWSPPPRCG